MGIGLMAVRTGIVRNGRFEVSTLVAAFARNLKMFADQWVVRLRVIEGRRKV